VSIKWAAILHSIVSALAVIPSIGLAIGLTIGAADSNTGALATLVVWLSGLFPGVLAVSIIVGWAAFSTRHLRAAWVATAFPWTYFLLLIATTALLIVIVALRWAISTRLSPSQTAQRPTVIQEIDRTQAVLRRSGHCPRFVSLAGSNRDLPLALTRGAANVRAALMAYRDGIKSILDQTIAGIRRGERHDELVQHVTLLPQLAENPYLREFYDSVAWSGRAIYADTVGWFDGNTTHMFPLTEQDRAAKLIGLIGGAESVLARVTRWPVASSNGRLNSPITCALSIAPIATQSESRCRR